MALKKPARHQRMAGCLTVLLIHPGMKLGMEVLFMMTKVGGMKITLIITKWLILNYRNDIFRIAVAHNHANNLILNQV